MSALATQGWNPQQTCDLSPAQLLNGGGGVGGHDGSTGADSGSSARLRSCPQPGFPSISFEVSPQIVEYPTQKLNIERTVSLGTLQVFDQGIDPTFRSLRAHFKPILQPGPKM